MYVRLCKRHGITPEPEHAEAAAAAEDSDGDPAERKQRLAEEALESVVSGVKGGSTQWALTGEEGSREYVDFNKAMQGGVMTNMQMGPQVGEALHSVFEALASEHSHTLTSAIAEAPRVYDAGLHLSFCAETVRSCKRKGGKLVPRDDHDEL